MHYRKWPKVRKAIGYWKRVIYWCEEIKDWRERIEAGANIYS